jgi:hypothetical protein
LYAFVTGLSPTPDEWMRLNGLAIEELTSDAD